MSVFLLLQHNPTGNQQGPSQQLPRLSRQHTRHWHSPRPPDVRIQGPLTCPAAADQGACPRTSTDNLCCTQLCRHFLKRGDPFQFSPSVVSDSLRPLGLQRARLLCLLLSPMVCSNSFQKSIEKELVVLSNHLILCCPLLLLLLIFPGIRVFPSESTL